MEYKLTKEYKFVKHCLDGKDRNYLTYFLNGMEILKQKIPFDEKMERGYDRNVHIHSEYILGGKMFQKRQIWHGCCHPGNEKEIPREVSFPLSKKKLNEMGVPSDLKIEIFKNNS